MARARYGAGMIPSRSVSSAKASGVHLNARVWGRSVLTTANIFPPMLNTRSLPHLMSSVTAGRLRQKLRTASIDIWLVRADLKVRTTSEAVQAFRPEGPHYN
jgi:hypothetical protein